MEMNDPTATASDQEKPVVLMIADISGYTRFLTSHQNMVQAHAQVIINDLIQTIIKEVSIPIKLAKLEGDAVFLYAIREGPQQEWQKIKRDIGSKLLKFFEAFYDRVVQLSETSMCGCDSCTHVQELKLKMVVHSGNALLYKLGESLELAGVDVVIVHKLLKNSVPSDHYILLTEQASREIEFPTSIQVRQGQETYEDIGTIRTYIYHPPTVEDRYNLYINLGKNPSIFKKMGSTMGIVAKGMMVKPRTGKSERHGISDFGFAMIALGVFVTIALLAGLPLFLQWRAKVNLAYQTAELKTQSESHIETLSTYRDLDERYSELTERLHNASRDASRIDYVLKAVQDELPGGVRITGILFEDEEIILTCLVPSQTKLSMYASHLLDNAGLEAVSIDRTGVKGGLTEFTLSLRRLR